jgi:FtsP/CotA-like multicopper oxidase with cupredoxin domain
MTRRELLSLTCGCWTSAVARSLDAHAPAPAQLPALPPTAARDADITLRIAELTLDLAPRRSVRTLAYNGQVPGPLLRAPQGKPIVVDVRNDTRDEEFVHWHGFHIPSEVDGSMDEGTPGVPPNGNRRYTFVPDPVGTRWYHSHTMAGRNLGKSTYSGQFGMFIVEAAENRVNADREVALLLHEWDPRFTNDGPMDVEYRFFSINGKMLGAGDPIRVRPSERVLFRIVNASATLTHRLALPRHTFFVTALDGNPVPNPASVSSLELAPGERVDAIVEMNAPGVWIFGETRTARRSAGMGTIIEYADRSGPPVWLPPTGPSWNYLAFASREAAPEPDERAMLAFRATSDGHHWTINGKSFPKTDPILVRPGRRIRLAFDNQSADDHPVHLHRHTFEIVRFAGEALSGIRKDVVTVPAWKQVEVDVPTNQPGLTLFHCHQQFHMDMGFMTLMKYV